ncbi:MAG: type II toxin-antitoxin system VapC family toxin [Capsulimonas sp.]|uniref:type II toxin-antitoxin system VapC family toxin n=1 Tax=Capsulimonas sp. TaxID=2494211 RepID=UPI0032632B16
MAAIPPNNIGAVVIDANIVIALASREAGRVNIVNQELLHYVSLGYDWYAPGAIVSEALYALCQKLNTGVLDAAQHQTAIITLQRTLTDVFPPPQGEHSLIQRAEEIRIGYGCSRSADTLYIALAEELSQSMPTVLLTFDQDLPKQAAKNAPNVNVKLL